MHYTPFRATHVLVAGCLGLGLTVARADKPTAVSRSSSSKVSAPQLKSHCPVASPGNDKPAVRSIAPQGEDIARTALSYRGAPYRRGGNTSRGFDCSGLVRAVCAKYGVYLPRAAKQQFSSAVGTRVQPSELLPGDLVFFSGTYKSGTSHVGIYVGDGKFLHASTPAEGVIVSDLNEAYHRTHYCGAIRLDLSKLPAK